METISIKNDEVTITFQGPSKVVKVSDYAKKLVIQVAALQAQLDDTNSKLTQIETAIGKDALDAIKASVTPA